VAKPCVVAGCTAPLVARGWCQKHYKAWRRNGTPEPLAPEELFFRHVTEAENGCWNYAPSNTKTGYAVFAINKGTNLALAHRWSYEHFVADIPAGLVIDHLCNNRACVNPWHLEPVTQKVNCQRGVGSASSCVNGHPYNPSNTEVHSRGHRQCRTCRQNRERRFKTAALALGGESNSGYPG
jgi:hypothetical protein